MQPIQTQSSFQLSDIQRVWPRVLIRVQNTMPTEQFETWVQGVQPISYEHNICVMQVRNAYVQSWLASRMSISFGEFLSSELNELMRTHDDFVPGSVSVKFQVDTQEQIADENQTSSISDLIWNKVLNELQLEVPRASFETWVRDTQALSIQNQTLKIAARNTYTCDWLETRLQDRITQLVKEYDNSIAHIQFVVGELDSLPQQDDEEATEVEPEATQQDVSSTNFTAEIVDATQYENEVHPDRIVALDGYALRLMEHGDLSPKDLSLWVGFRQAVYRHMKNNKGSVKNIPYRDVIQFAMMSRATYFRETTNKQESGIAGGLVEEVGVDAAVYTKDRHIDNARRFRVHMAPRLTRQDCETIERLIEQEVCQAATFEEAREIALKALQRLAEESPSKFLNNVDGNKKAPSKSWPRSIAEIVRRVLDLRGDMPQDLHAAAEKLQNRILFGFGRIFITHHFLKVAAPMLGLTHPQAWAIIALRDRRWYDHETGVEENYAIVRGGLDELGAMVGVDRKTVKRWMSHAGFQMFVKAEVLGPDELPEGWDPRTTIFTVRQDEPLRTEILGKEGKNVEQPLDEADKMSNASDKMSNGTGQSEQRCRTKRVTVPDKVSNGAGQNEQRLNRFNKTLVRPTQTQESPPAGFPPETPGTLPRAVVGNGGFWDFDVLMINNSVLKPVSILAANKKFGRDLKTACEGFVSRILYAYSEHGGKLRIDPTSTAVSGLCKNLSAGAGSDYDRLAKLPPHALKAIFEKHLHDIPCDEDDDDAQLFQWHYQNLPSEDKGYLYRRLFGDTLSRGE